ncbi:MAG: T9SS type A sorting domain-containing protein [Algibacter sp.]|uniref:T9SS type A sorting domain-containing protein n=1 Tax=Algibacter sp. TaxID=1872428 RepID=UPI003296F534
MNKITLLFSLLAISFGFSQNAPIDFETGGHGASWTWSVFENGANPAVEIIANPVPVGINTSATVMKFTALDAGMNWAGCESMHGSDIGTWTPSAANSYVTMKVYQVGFASQVALKYATSSGWAIGEVFAPVSTADTWVEVSFDMSEWIGGAGGDPDQIILFPDHSDRTADHIIYIDDISFSTVPEATCTDGIKNGDETGVDCGGSSCAACPVIEPTDAPPTPTTAAMDVISIYSDAYTTTSGVDYNPNWGQSTAVTVDYSVASNNTLKYENLNYQGTDWTANSLDLSEYNYLHIDFWSHDSSDLGIYLISGVYPTNVEKEFVFTVTADQWNSVDIPLSYFSNLGVDISDANQFKVEGNGTVFLDNLYFSKANLSVNDLSTSSFKLFPNPSQQNWNIESQKGQIQSITVYNVVGKQVLAFTPNASKAIVNGSVLTPGLYFVIIKTESGIGNIKLIKN